VALLEHYVLFSSSNSASSCKCLYQAYFFFIFCFRQCCLGPLNCFCGLSVFLVGREFLSWFCALFLLFNWVCCFLWGQIKPVPVLSMLNLLCFILYALCEDISVWFLLLCEFIFPDFPGQKELFSLTNLFTQNTNVGFQSLAITLETKVAEQI